MPCYTFRNGNNTCHTCATLKKPSFTPMIMMFPGILRFIHFVWTNVKALFGSRCNRSAILPNSKCNVSHRVIHASRNLQSLNVIGDYARLYIGICITWYLKLPNNTSENYLLYVQGHAEDFILKAFCTLAIRNATCQLHTYANVTSLIETPNHPQPLHCLSELTALFTVKKNYDYQCNPGKICW